MSEFLLEIGTEELPANFANEAREQLKELAEKWLKENTLNFESLKTFSTPRRLVVFVEGLSAKQPDLEKELKGPAVNIAYDAEGKPTKALEGFCKSQNINPETLEKKDFKGNLFVYATVKQAGKNASELLPGLIQQLLSSLSVTRSMRWGDTNTKFSRPIHWILSLLDGELIPFTLEELNSCKYTFGHRFLSNGKLEVDSAKTYFKVLAENKVELDNEARKENIKNQLQKIADANNAKVTISPSLLNEVNQLVEYPTAIMGSFEEKYLQIPDIVTITVMKSHQRYFPLFSQDGKLLPNFITISNMNLNPENIKSGNEKVLKARLQDAIFYYEDDLKNSLESNLEELKRVTYFEEIGSVFDKVCRIERISAYLAENYFKIDLNKVKRSAKLCKADLVTSMVQEFTELQGEIGYYYALKAGEDENVAIALKEQYLPTGNNDGLPSNPLSQVINFADKLDNLVSCFALGKIPTGSKDPFSLRRQCLGIIKTCERYKIALNLHDVLNLAWDTLADQKNITTDKAESLTKIKEFFTQRLKNELLDHDLRYDLVDAVLNSENPLGNIYSTREKLNSVSEWVNSGKATEAIMAMARIIRICKEKVAVNVNDSLFEKEEEKELHKVFINLKPTFDLLMKDNDFVGLLNKFSELVEPVNKFFDHVMVMAENPEIKNNRMALLQQIKAYSDEIANMDKINLSL